MISTTNPLKARAQALYQKTNWAEESGLAKTSRETAQLYQAAFDSLDLGNCGDPAGESIQSAMAPLKNWAQGNDERLSTVYQVGLEVAANGIGGPLGAVLAEQHEFPVLGRLSTLAQHAGKSAQPLLEAALPESWVQAEPGIGRDQWSAGQSLALVREDRSDAIRYLNSSWTSHLEGEAISAARVDATVAQIENFTRERQAQGWIDARGYAPSDLEGHRVAFLAPEGRELKAFEGRVTDTKRGMARFKLEGSERSFNSNSMFATVRERPAGHRDRPRLNLDDSMTPEQRLAELDRLYRGA